MRTRPKKTWRLFGSVRIKRRLSSKGHTVKKYLYFGKQLCAALGLAVLLVVIGSGASDPSPVFRIGAPLALGLFALALLLMIADWAWELRDAVRQRQPVEVLGLLLGAAVMIGIFVFRR